MIAPVEPTVTELLWTAQQAADALQICEKTLWTLTQPRGPIPAIRLGKSVRYSPAALAKWIEEQQAAPEVPA
jgi:hypothetical protein